MNLSTLFPWDMLRSDRALRMMFSALTTLVLIMLTISSCAIWPAVLSLRGAENQPWTDLCNAVVAAAIPLIGVDVLMAIVLGWFDKRYSFLKSILATYLFGFVVMICVLFAVPVNLEGVVSMTFAMQVLRVVFTLMLGVVLAFLPALLSSILGFVVREVYYVVSEMRR